MVSLCPLSTSMISKPTSARPRVRRTWRISTICPETVWNDRVTGFRVHPDLRSHRGVLRRPDHRRPGARGPQSAGISVIHPICHYLGLDWSSQRQRLNRDEVLAEGVVVIAIPTP